MGRVWIPVVWGTVGRSRSCRARVQRRGRFEADARRFDCRDMTGRPVARSLQHCDDPRATLPTCRRFSVASVACALLLAIVASASIDPGPPSRRRCTGARSDFRR